MRDARVSNRLKSRDDGVDFLKYARVLEWVVCLALPPLVRPPKHCEDAAVPPPDGLHGAECGLVGIPPRPAAERPLDRQVLGAKAQYQALQLKPGAIVGANPVLHCRGLGPKIWVFDVLPEPAVPLRVLVHLLGQGALSRTGVRHGLPLITRAPPLAGSPTLWGSLAARENRRGQGIPGVGGGDQVPRRHPHVQTLEPDAGKLHVLVAVHRVSPDVHAHGQIARDFKTHVRGPVQRRPEPLVPAAQIPLVQVVLDLSDGWAEAGAEVEEIRLEPGDLERLGKGAGLVNKRVDVQ
mmetsp:Transcript_64292/g.145012  ORF Transcript_64292/g.145012 Transcript_64292/m.145012 type:complete len:294 (+) Transcript_64292:185-1066(+)